MHCRRRPPQAVCHACQQANNGCTGYCRDAFVYDPSWTDDEIVEELRNQYTIGGLGGAFEFNLAIPERILALVALPPAPGARIRKLVGDLQENCNWWDMLAVNPKEKPTLAGNPLEWQTNESGSLEVSHHVEGQQHTYVTVSQNGDIAITLSLPLENDSHDLFLRKGELPVYTHDPIDINAGFPEERFTSWLEEAIESCRLM